MASRPALVKRFSQIVRELKRTHATLFAIHDDQSHLLRALDGAAAARMSRDNWQDLRRIYLSCESSRDQLMAHSSRLITQAAELERRLDSDPEY